MKLSILILSLSLILLNTVYAVDKKNHAFFDIGYLTPLGLEAGAGWGPAKSVEAYLQGGIIAFKTGTGLDEPVAHTKLAPGGFLCPG